VTQQDIAYTATITFKNLMITNINIPLQVKMPIPTKNTALQTNKAHTQITTQKNKLPHKYTITTFTAATFYPT
jgi:hypothetical protein